MSTKPCAFLPASAAVAAAAAGLLLSSASALGVDIYDSGGFESPRFTAGVQLEGQDVLMGPWIETFATSPDDASVLSGVGVGGSNGVRVTATAGGDNATAWFVDKPLLPASPLSTVVVNWDMSVQQTNVAGLDFGPFFGVEAFDASDAGNIKQIGGFGVDASTGDLVVLFNDAGTVQYFPLLTPQTVAFDDFGLFEMRLDFDAAEFTIAYDGVDLETNPFVDPTAAFFTDAPITTQFLSFAGDEGLSQGIADFDNYSISLVPEPGAMAALAGVGGLIGLRRRSRR